MTLVNPQMISSTWAALDAVEADVLRGLLNKWAAKSRRNVLRSSYYDGKNRLKDLGISLPPQLKNVEAVIGWPAKAVDLLEQRINFDGFVHPSAEQDPYDVTGLLLQNQFDSELPQAIRSSLIHSVAFVSTVSGDVQSGEPEVLTRFRSALWATGEWDRARRSLSSAVSITAADEYGVPTAMVLYMPDRVVVLEKSPAGVWRAARRRNPLNRVPVEPLRFRPDLDRPMGRSRISRAVMSITDEAMRTVLRTESGAEFYNAPQRYLLGADEDAFTDDEGNTTDAWSAILGMVLQVGRDEDGNLPTIGEFRQQSMEPNNAMFRMEAARFAGETGISVDSLGIVSDNPSSAEGIHAAREDLIIEAENAGRVYEPSLVRVAQNIVMLRDGLSDVPADLLRLRGKWRRADRPSAVSMSDAMVKQVSAFPWMAESDVALEELGYDQATVMRLQADRRRAQSGSLVDRLTQIRPTAGAAEVASRRS